MNNTQNGSHELGNEYLQQSQALLDQAMLKIEHCLEQLTDQQICLRAQPGLNSVANLILHVAGNLRQWGIVPNSPTEVDRRNRDAEFNDCDVTKKELLDSLRETVAQAKQIFGGMKDAEDGWLLLEQSIQGFTMSRLAAITHTTTHFVGHTHQIIMMTRMILGDRYKFHWGDDGGDRSQVPI